MASLYYVPGDGATTKDEALSDREALDLLYAALEEDDEEEA